MLVAGETGVIGVRSGSRLPPAAEPTCTSGGERRQPMKFNFASLALWRDQGSNPKSIGSAKTQESPGLN